MIRMTPELEAILLQLLDEERLGPVINLCRGYSGGGYRTEAELLQRLDSAIYEAKQP